MKVVTGVLYCKSVDFRHEEGVKRIGYYPNPPYSDEEVITIELLLQKGAQDSTIGSNMQARQQTIAGPPTGAPGPGTKEGPSGPDEMIEPPRSSTSTHVFS